MILLLWKMECRGQERMLQRLVRRQVNAIYRDRSSLFWQCYITDTLF